MLPPQKRSVWQPPCHHAQTNPDHVRKFANVAILGARTLHRVRIDHTPYTS